jgi:putative oxidoreductase
MKLTSVNYSASAFNLGMLVLRIGAGVLLLAHGYDKIQHFSQYSSQFINFLGMGQKTSLMLTIFAEFGCSALVILGLLTRWACIPVIINMLVALFKAHKADVFGQGEHATLFAVCFIVIMILGPGRVSVDGMISRN